MSIDTHLDAPPRHRPGSSGELRTVSAARLATLSAAPVSVVVIVKNEATNIARCIQALNWCDDIVVVDDHSTDGTADVAREAGARVVTHRFESFAAQRNWAMESVDLHHEWVLHLDADEVSTPEFANCLIDAVANAPETVGAFCLCRKTMFCNRWLKHADAFPVWIMRLVRRGRAQFENHGHGEVAVPKVQGEVRQLREPFLHFAFSKGLSDWIDRHNRYSTREAKLETESRETWEWRQLLSRNKIYRRTALRAMSRRLPLRPVLRFGYQYIYKMGFLDGHPGFLFCLLMATYEGLIVAKCWEIERKRRGVPS